MLGGGSATSASGDMKGYKSPFHRPNRPPTIPADQSSVGRNKGNRIPWTGVGAECSEYNFSHGKTNLLVDIASNSNVGPPYRSPRSGTVKAPHTNGRHTQVGIVYPVNLDFVIV